MGPLFISVFPVLDLSFFFIFFFFPGDLTIKYQLFLHSNFSQDSLFEHWVAYDVHITLWDRFSRGSSLLIGLISRLGHLAAIQPILSHL